MLVEAQLSGENVSDIVHGKKKKKKKKKVKKGKRAKKGRRKSDSV